ncbi:MAG: LysE family transporter [Parachlamydiaceae bacterium]|nr:MAG: LysE family transporter [Parachlamydiaceae bacterium]
MNPISPYKAFSQGFLTNLLNPKAALFYVSLFSQFIDPATPSFLRLEYALVNWCVTLGWFLLLSYMVTSQLFLGKIAGFRLYIDRMMGCALMILGLKLLLFKQGFLCKLELYIWNKPIYCYIKPG